MEKIYNIKIDQDFEGKRIDSVLSALIPETSRNFIQKLFQMDRISVNGELCTLKKYKVQLGDNLKLEMPEPEKLEIKAENIPIDIVYEDDDLLVINKAKGMVVHPAIGNYTGTLVNGIMYHCGDRLSSINGVIRPGIVHRIDKDTSGLLMVAKNNKAHESLSMQLFEHTITRKYVALVYDNIKEEEGVVNLPLGRDPNNRLKRCVNGLNSKKAITHYSVLERFGKYTLIEAALETGRTHQIRVHMTYIKHPLVGDPLYGPKKKNDDQFKIEGQMLHAKILGFIHPTTGKYMEFNSDLPEYFCEILNKLRGDI